jgi:hypothetical protein
MKKLIYTVMLLLGLSIISVSCSNSDSPKAQARKDFHELEQAIEQYLEEGTLIPLETTLTQTENKLDCYGMESTAYYEYLRTYVGLFFDDTEITEFIGHCDNINDDEVELLFDEVLNSIVALVEPDELEIFKFKF